MIQIIIAKWILKKGSVAAFLKFGDLLVSITKSKKDDKMWAKVRPIIEEFK